MPRPQWFYGRHPPTCTCVECNKRRLDRRAGMAQSAESPREARTHVQRAFRGRRRLQWASRAFWRLAIGLLSSAIIGLVVLTGGLVGFHWYQGAPFDTSVRMMIDDYRVAVLCPGEYRVVLNFVDRSGLDTTVANPKVVLGDDWVREICYGTEVAPTAMPVSPPPTPATLTSIPTPPPHDQPVTAEELAIGASTKPRRVGTDVGLSATSGAASTPPSSTASSVVTSTPAPPKPSQDAAAPLRQLAMNLVNERRRQLGVADLNIGDSVAAQLHANQSLGALELLRVTEDGIPPEMLYTAHGGRGYIRWMGQIGGYWPESSVIECGSRRVTCEQVVPETEVATYIRGRVSEDMAKGGEGLLSPRWTTLHLGIAHTDLTIVIIEYLERQGLDYVREPTISRGFLSLQVIPKFERNIELVQVYRHQMLSDAPNQARESETRVLAIFEPPQRGHSVRLPDDISVVADYWANDGESIEIVVALADRLPGPGVYEFVIWTVQDIPASQYFIRVEDSNDIELDLTAQPFDEPERPSLESLRLFALDLINVDREKHGVPPVKLGTNASAQIHAEDALSSGYLVGHWTADGRKPYMLYRQAGGTGIVAENAAGGGFPLAECQKPRVVCGSVDTKAQIADHQWGMMYDDAHADWGHRDTIISPNYDTVNIGIAFDEHRLRFYQHFEYNGLAYVKEPVLGGGLLRLHPLPLDGHAIGNIAVYSDPSPTPKLPSEIELLTSYCTGGGFTDDCDDVGPIALVLKPPPPGSSYVGLNREYVVARVWNELEDGSVEIEAELNSLVDRSGVYTLVVMSASEDSRPLSQYSIFK